MPRADTLDEKREKALAKLAGTTTEQPKAPSIEGAPRRIKKGVFNGTRGKLVVDGEVPGYHMHIINDDRTRLQDATDNGYEFVNPDEIKGVSENVVSRNGELGKDRVRFLVGSQENGQPMYGYLMKIRQEWYDEDQVELQAQNDKIDNAIRRGKTTGDNPAFYIPRGGIKVTQE